MRHVHVKLVPIRIPVTRFRLLRLGIMTCFSLIFSILFYSILWILSYSTVLNLFYSNSILFYIPFHSILFYSLRL